MIECDFLKVGGQKKTATKEKNGLLLQTETISAIIKDLTTDDLQKENKMFILGLTKISKTSFMNMVRLRCKWLIKRYISLGLIILLVDIGYIENNCCHFYFHRASSSNKTSKTSWATRWKSYNRRPYKASWEKLKASKVSNYTSRIARCRKNIYCQAYKVTREWNGWRSSKNIITRWLFWMWWRGRFEKYDSYSNIFIYLV